MGLIGPNGSGKTTVFNVITGLYRATAGMISFDGKTDLVGLPPHTIATLGIARTFQNQRLFNQMTVLENVLVALPRQSGDRLLTLFLRPWHVRREDAANARRAMAILEFIGLRERAFDLAEDLSYAEEKLLVRIERQIGQRLPRVTLPDFNYTVAAPARTDRPAARPRGPGPSRPGQGKPRPPQGKESSPSKPQRKGGNKPTPSSQRRRPH